MSFAARLGDITIPAGSHASFTPSSAIAGSGTVFANSMPVVRQGDAFAPHMMPPAFVHVPSANECSGSVSAEGSGIARMGDAVDCGQIISIGSPDVIVGD